jgi:hypothetical protein
MIQAEQVWVFNHARGSFPGGIFTSLHLADRWIEQHRLTGTLTSYPVDTWSMIGLLLRGSSVLTNRIRLHPIS